MNNYNVIIYVLEDDKKMSSSFLNDLQNIMVKNNKIPINIIYHSKYFFGNMRLSVNGEKAFIEETPKFKAKYDNITEEIKDLYKKNYKKGSKNIFVFCGHIFYLYSNQNEWKGGNVFEDLDDLELVILDSCYSMRLNILERLVGKTKFVIGCQTTSPNYGFLTSSFIDILNSDYSDLTKYKKIINSYIERNSLKKYPYEEFNYKTDGVLVDLTKFKKLIKDIKMLRLFPKKSLCRIEKSSGYNFYDMICTIKNNKNINDSVRKDMIQTLESSILYRKQNYLQKQTNLSGISLELLK